MFVVELDEVLNFTVELERLLLLREVFVKFNELIFGKLVELVFVAVELLFVMFVLFLVVDVFADIVVVLLLV